LVERLKLLVRTTCGSGPLDFRFGILDWKTDPKSEILHPKSDQPPAAAGGSDRAFEKGERLCSKGNRFFISG
jgi:hypothetical protein